MDSSGTLSGDVSRDSGESLISTNPKDSREAPVSEKMLGKRYICFTAIATSSVFNDALAWQKTRRYYCRAIGIQEAPIWGRD